VHRRIPIVVVSGDSNPESPARSLRRGADAYFTKPFSPSEVRRKIEELIHAA
jgi:CheY-like chemotaxis protein